MRTRSIYYLESQLTDASPSVHRLVLTLYKREADLARSMMPAYLSWIERCPPRAEVVSSNLAGSANYILESLYFGGLLEIPPPQPTALPTTESWIKPDRTVRSSTIVGRQLHLPANNHPNIMKLFMRAVVH
jgi:hypothetical protein